MSENPPKLKTAKEKARDPNKRLSKEDIAALKKEKANKEKEERQSTPRLDEFAKQVANKSEESELGQSFNVLEQNYRDDRAALQRMLSKLRDQRAPTEEQKKVMEQLDEITKKYEKDKKELNVQTKTAAVRKSVLGEDTVKDDLEDNISKAIDSAFQQHKNQAIDALVKEAVSLAGPSKNRTPEETQQRLKEIELELAQLRGEKLPRDSVDTADNVSDGSISEDESSRWRKAKKKLSRAARGFKTQGVMNVTDDGTVYPTRPGHKVSRESRPASEANFSADNYLAGKNKVEKNSSHVEPENKARQKIERKYSNRLNSLRDDMPDYDEAREAILKQKEAELRSFDQKNKTSADTKSKKSQIDQATNNVIAGAEDLKQLAEGFDMEKYSQLFDEELGKSFGENNTEAEKGLNDTIDKIYPASSEQSKEKIRNMALLRNHMKKMQAQYDQAATEYYRDRKVRHQLRDYVWGSVIKGEKVPASLQDAHAQLEAAKNARREYAANMRADKGNALSPSQMYQLMSAYDRYTNETHDYDNLKQKGDSYEAIKQAKNANTNWWNRMPTKTKALMGGSLLAGSAVMTSGVTLVALPAALAAGGAVSWGGKKWQKFRAGKFEKDISATANAGNINKLLQQDRAHLDVMEANTLRAKIGAGIAAGLAVGFTGKESIQAAWDQGWENAQEFGSDMLTKIEEWWNTPTPDTTPLSDTTPTHDVAPDGIVLRPLGDYTYVKGDNVYDIVIEKVIKASPEMQHLSDLEQRNLAMNFIDKLKANPDLSVALTGSEDPSFIAQGDEARLQGWRQLITQDGLWTLDRANDAVGEFSNMLEAADALDPNTNAETGYGPDGNMTFEEAQADDAQRYGADVYEDDSAPRAGFVEGLHSNSTWSQLEQALSDNKTVPYEQVRALIDGPSGQYAEGMKALQNKYNSPMYVEKMSTTSSGETLITFNTQADGNGTSVELNRNTLTAKVVPKGLFASIFGNLFG